MEIADWIVLIALSALIWAVLGADPGWSIRTPVRAASSATARPLRVITMRARPSAADCAPASRFDADLQNYLGSIGRIPLLTKDQEVELATVIERAKAAEEELRRDASVPRKRRGEVLALCPCG